MARLVRRPMLAAVVVAAALAGGCAQSAGTSPAAVTASPKALSISNGTTIPVTLVVNGAVVETVAPGGYQDPITALMPALPWAVETRSPSGRVLSSLTIGAADNISTTSGKGARAGLSCGRLDVWSGPPMLGPVFNPGHPATATDRPANRESARALCARSPREQRSPDRRGRGSGR